MGRIGFIKENKEEKVKIDTLKRKRIGFIDDEINELEPHRKVGIGFVKEKEKEVVTKTIIEDIREYDKAVDRYLEKNKKRLEQLEKLARIKNEKITLIERVQVPVKKDDKKIIIATK